MSDHGYGYTTTSTPSGRLFCVLYGMVGMPLTMITLADLARFASEFIVKTVHQMKGFIIGSLLNRSRDSVRIELPVFFVSFLFVLYPCIGALLYVYLGIDSFVDSLYFCFVSIFTIGFGDIHPPGGATFQTYLICIIYLCVGMILVSVAIDVVVAQCITDVHFLGRKDSDILISIVIDMKALTARLRSRLESGNLVLPGISFAMPTKVVKASPHVSEKSFANGHAMQIVYADSYTSLESDARLL